jgi:MoxR-like ATPase
MPDAPESGQQGKDGAGDLPSREELAAAKATVGRLARALSEVILGQDELIRMVVCAMLARGHVLFEGLPGLGKTQLVRALSRLTDLDFRRIQFTPDLMPGDVTGTHILVEREGSRVLEFQAGPVFANVVLADEINRASPKTQSAMLEAMQERACTVLGETRPLPKPFFVLATQNPIELEGTYPLPEAQLDRFLFKLDVHDVSADILAEILRVRGRGDLPDLAPVLTRKDLAKLFALTDRIYLPDAVRSYIARLVSSTHPDGGPERVRQFVKYGSSPRGAISIANAARALAVVEGKPNVGFDEVKRVAPRALGHRIILDYTARLERFTERDAVSAALSAVDELDRALPTGAQRTEA